MRTIVVDLLKRLNAVGVPEPIFEFGAARAPSQVHLPSVRSQFAGRRFTGSDMIAGFGVDQLHNLDNLGLRDNSIGTALLFDTIEHVRHPMRALDELQRCLASNGILILTTHFFFPIHRYPSDYWRFTAEGLEALLEGFPFRHAAEGGLALFPHTVAAIAGGADVPAAEWNALTGGIDDWLQEGASTWKETLLNLLPPALLQEGYKRYAAGNEVG